MKFFSRLMKRLDSSTCIVSWIRKISKATSTRRCRNPFRNSNAFTDWRTLNWNGRKFFEWKECWSGFGRFLTRKASTRNCRKISRKSIASFSSFNNTNADNCNGAFGRNGCSHETWNICSRRSFTRFKTSTTTKNTNRCLKEYRISELEQRHRQRFGHCFVENNCESRGGASTYIQQQQHESIGWLLTSETCSLFLFVDRLDFDFWQRKPLEHSTLRWVFGRHEKLLFSGCEKH